MAKLFNTKIDFPNTGVRIQDTDASHTLAISCGSNLSADRTLTFTSGDANRILDISSGDVTISTAGAALIDDANASAQRTTLGLGTAATQNTGSSGANLPILNVSNTWGALQQFGGVTSATKYTQIAEATGNITIRNDAGSGSTGGLILQNRGVAASGDGIGIYYELASGNGSALGACRQIVSSDGSSSYTGSGADAKYEMYLELDGSLVQRDLINANGNRFFSGPLLQITNTNSSNGAAIALSVPDAANNTSYIEFYSRSSGTFTRRGVFGAASGSYLQMIGENGWGWLIYGGSNLAQTVYSTGGVTFGSPTGGDKGQGTINASSIYDDNMLLVCFVIEYARTGTIDFSFWDSLSPTGRHEAAHRFWDEREHFDIDSYAKYWRDKGHLMGLPSREEWRNHAKDQKPIGDMINRLWATVEIQAVHIAELNDRYKKLEDIVSELVTKTSK